VENKPSGSLARQQTPLHDFEHGNTRLMRVEQRGEKHVSSERARRELLR
jgi:hypothetical protein